MWATKKEEENYLELDDAALLAQSDVQIYKSSGPGGQHRNKVSSAVRVRHKATGVAAHGDESRSQHDNKRMAVRRLRMNMACRLRRPVDRGSAVPSLVGECIFIPRGKGQTPQPRLKIGRRDQRFWAVVAYLLDVLEEFDGRLSEAAEHVGITTSNFADTLQCERHLLAAAQQIRKAHGHASLK